jgi:Zn finger protein HypA/HybF involved in hydrogenase expression
MLSQRWKKKRRLGDWEIEDLPFISNHLIFQSSLNNTFPPPNYVQAESAVAGITVYMPRPAVEEHKEVVDFRCPQCDGVTAYSADDGGLTCAFCGYHEAPQAELVGKGAEEFEFTVETMHRATHGWGIERKELVCNNCNAHTTLSTDMLTHTCPFCASNQVVQARAPQDVLRPRFLVPLTMTQDACREKTAVWLRSSWMLPKELDRLARTAEYTPIYIPFWTFDAQSDADWKAEVGHVKTRRVHTKNGWRTQTYVEWRWESGHARLFIDDLIVQGTGRISGKLLQEIGRYQLDKLVSYDAAFLAGVQAQAYDIGLEEAWEMGRGQMRERTKQACTSQASSSRIRNFSMNLEFNNESWRYILLPVYLATYRYGTESYQVVINGQTGHLAGQRPVDWRKIWLVIAALMAPGVILAILSQVVASMADFIPFAVILAIVGLVISVVIFIQAQKMDDI